MQIRISYVANRGSTIGLVGCGIWLILRAGFGMRVKNRSKKGDFKYKREQDNAFLRARDAGIVGYSMLLSMAGYRITVPCTRETLSGGGAAVDLTGDVGHSVGDADDGDEYESSSSAEEEEFEEDESQTLST